LYESAFNCTWHKNSSKSRKSAVASRGLAMSLRELGLNTPDS
jgi:hypothetical protein